MQARFEIASTKKSWHALDTAISRWLRLSQAPALPSSLAGVARRGPDEAGELYEASPRLPSSGFA